MDKHDITFILFHFSFTLPGRNKEERWFMESQFIMCQRMNKTAEPICGDMLAFPRFAPATDSVFPDNVSYILNSKLLFTFNVIILFVIQWFVCSTHQQQIRFKVVSNTGLTQYYETRILSFSKFKFSECTFLRLSNSVMTRNLAKVTGQPGRNAEDNFGNHSKRNCDHAVIMKLILGGREGVLRVGSVM